MLTFIISTEKQSLPSWLSNAIATGHVVVQGDSTSDIQYYVVDGQTAGPGDVLEFKCGTVCIKG